MRSVLGEPVKIQQCACNCQLPATRLIQFTQQTSAKTIIGKVRLYKIYIDSAQIGFFEQWSGLYFLLTKTLTSLTGGWFTLFPTILSPSSWAPSMGHPSWPGQAETAEERHHHRQIPAMATDDRSTASGDKFSGCFHSVWYVSQSFHNRFTWFHSFDFLSS